MKCDCLQFIFRLPSVHVHFFRFATEGEPLASTHWYGAGPARHEKHEWPHEERHVFQDAAQCGGIPELCIQLLGHSAWTSDCLLCNIAADPVCIFLRQNRWLSKTLQNMSHMSDPCWAQPCRAFYLSVRSYIYIYKNDMQTLFFLHIRTQTLELKRMINNQTKRAVESCRKPQPPTCLFASLASAIPS